jgi:sensor histidine kinase YesM
LPNKLGTVRQKLFVMPVKENCEKFNIRSEIRDMVILVVLGMVMTWTGISCDTCDPKTKEFWIIGSFTSLMWVVLWKGNDYVGRYISTKMSWIEFPVKRFFVGILSTFLFTFIAIFSLGNLYNYIFDLRITYGIMFSVVITLIISLFMHGRAFLLNWKQSSIDAEKLKRENIAAKYESLKNQVNPHFLFNSFNALSNLVYEDQDKAVKFIKQLSEVYRYVLDTRDKEVVPLSVEMKFLESYIYLQMIRFENKLKIVIEPIDNSVSVAPLALQMLIENAIKHNVVSEDEPLTVHLFEENGFIVVRNNLQPKSSMGEPSAGVGLENIIKRYEFLSKKKVEVLKTTDSFIVKLPVLSAL